jgi:hypothetical protein
LNPNQWEVQLIEFKLCEDTRPDPQLQKAKAQHSILMANLNRQGYREIKLHMILVEAMGTIYKDYTDKPLQTLIWITIRLNTVQSIDTQTERTLQQTSSALIKTRYALQYNTSNNSQGLGPGATAHNP